MTDSQGNTGMVEIKYSDLPNTCFVCKRDGHLPRLCLFRGVQPKSGDTRMDEKDKKQNCEHRTYVSMSNSEHGMKQKGKMKYKDKQGQQEPAFAKSNRQSSGETPGLKEDPSKEHKDAMDAELQEDMQMEENIREQRDEIGSLRQQDSKWENQRTVPDQSMDDEDMILGVNTTQTMSEADCEEEQMIQKVIKLTWNAEDENDADDVDCGNCKQVVLDSTQDEGCGS
jgi:hypothetical protein